MSYNSMVVRNGLDYHDHPYLGPSHPVNMSVDTQDPLASQNFGNHGNRPVSQPQDSSYNQSDYLLQQPYSQTSGFNFFRKFSPQNNISPCNNGERDANQNNSDKLLLKDLELIDRQTDSKNPKTPAVRSSNVQNPTHLNSVVEDKASLEFSKSQLSSHYCKEASKRSIDIATTPTNSQHHHSPGSNTSLSDSEVPTNEKHDNTLLLASSLVSLEGSRDPEVQSKDPVSEHGAESVRDQPDRCNEDKVDRSYPESQNLKDIVSKEESEREFCAEEKQHSGGDRQKEDKKAVCEVKEEVEDTVKEHLEEAIRQHHHRVVSQPVVKSPPPPLLPSNHPQHHQHHLLPTNTSVSPKSSSGTSGNNQPLLPSPLNNNHSSSSSHRLDISPNKASHIRHLNFNPAAAALHGSLKALRGDFPDFPPFLGVPPHHLAGLTFPHQQQLPPSALFADFIPRSRANTVPTTDIPRSRSSSFSSLPEQRHGSYGGRMKITGDGKELYYCHLCSFVGTTEDQFANHMDTHFEHQCPHCDYKSRTEGRLKRHIKDFHSEENPEDFTGGRITRKEPGKPKFFRCRQCDYVADEKEDYWKHARSHIKGDKCLQCPKCPFVTEYKHHLEYHLRNHFGSKPFKCNKCNYSCVNKSMLNSHMKSHTNVYQYRCQDCTYATKYCHSLKLHLSKYNHQPATVLNTDGSLPVDGSGDFELVSKRGPPRGPRLTKLPDSLQGYERMDANLLAMQTGTIGVSPNPLNGMAAMMGSLWPNGLTAPPPLMPVSGLAPLNVQLPHERRSSQGHSPSNIADLSHSSSESNGIFAGKCHFCEFVSQIPQEMVEHIAEEHPDKQDIVKMLQEREESEMREMMEYHMQMKTPPRGGERELFPFPSSNSSGITDFDVMRAKYALENSSNSGSEGSPNKASQFSTPENKNGIMANYDHSNSCSPNKSPLSDTSPNSLDARYMRNSVEDSPASFEGRRRKPECPLDLTGKLNGDEDLSPGSAGKRPWENGYEDQNGELNQSLVSSHYDEAEGGLGELGPQKKRSRKGKAYKLDMISIKLQEQYSEQEDNNGDFSSGDNDYFPQDHSNPGSDARVTITPDIKTEPLDSDNDLIHQFDQERPDTADHGMKADDQTVAKASSSSEKVDALSVFSGSMERRRLFVQQKSPVKKTCMPESQESNRNMVEEESLSPHKGVQSQLRHDVEAEQVLGEHSSQNERLKYECGHCGIAFRDCIMYTMHMGYHGFQDPFTCNRCGEASNDKIEFFLHIARKAHA